MDNLQPEYLYEHMAPVRPALLRNLWKTVCGTDQTAALSALRLLGKFGGYNRKILYDTYEFQPLLEQGESPAFRYAAGALQKSGVIFEGGFPQKNPFGCTKSGHGACTPSGKSSLN